MVQFTSLDAFLSALPAIAAEHADKLQGQQGCIALFVPGRSPVAFRLDENGKITQVDPAAVCPDCSVHAKEADLLLILSGELHPLKALMTGRVTVRGSTAKLMNIIRSLS